MNKLYIILIALMLNITSCGVSMTEIKRGYTDEWMLKRTERHIIIHAYAKGVNRHYYLVKSAIESRDIMYEMQLWDKEFNEGDTVRVTQHIYDNLKIIR